MTSAGPEISLPQPAPGVGSDAADEGRIIELLGLQIRDATVALAADSIVRRAIAGRRTRVSFVNAHCVNVAARHRGYLEALSSSDLIYADGVGMAIAARAEGLRLSDNVNGTDLFPALCRRAAEQGVPLALLGGRPGVAELCAERMRACTPGLDIVYTRDGYYPRDEMRWVQAGINASGARIVLVAKGVPQQELWIANHADGLDAPVLMGVGALFDFYSGLLPRCPRALRRLRLEWFFRLALEPRRLFTRYVVGNPLFLYRIMRRQRLI